MSSIYNFIRLSTNGFIRSYCKFKTIHRTFIRNYADKSKLDSSTKQVVVQGTENLARFRVRRARPADVPKVVRFVRDNAPLAWPGLVSSSPGQNNNLLLADYVSRTLCQGHSMLAEQQEAKRGWTRIRGLALNTSICPWDAVMLEKFAHCVRSDRFRQLMMFAAHCLRAPGLHDKYHVHNILQVVLMVPPDSPRASEIIEILAKNSIQRARDVGYPVLRFDVTNDTVTQVMEDLKLEKEWETDYETLKSHDISFSKAKENKCKTQSLAVYCAFPQKEIKSSQDK